MKKGVIDVAYERASHINLIIINRKAKNDERMMWIDVLTYQCG